MSKIPLQNAFLCRGFSILDYLSIGRKQVKENLSDVSIHWNYSFYNISLQFDIHRSINLDFLPLDFPGPKNQKYYVWLDISLQMLVFSTKVRPIKVDC